jgi:xylulokinase
MLLGIDVGTGSTKALLLDPDGSVAGAGAEPHPVHAARRGWAETDPEQWWTSTRAAVAAALGDAGVGGDQVRAIGFSGQMHGVVLAGADGRPLREAILWADGRAVRELDAYAALPAPLLERLANPVVTGMAGPSLLWLATHESGALRDARWALQPKDWLRLRLTGAAATDPSDASATLLFDVERDGWHDELIAALGLPGELLAPIQPAAAPAGELDASAAADLGLPAGVPVVTGAADTAAGAVGTRLAGSGEAQLTVGTGAQVIVDLPAPRRDATLRTHLFRAAVPGGWYAMAAMQNAGLALEWCLRALGRDWAWAYEHAFTGPPGAAGVTFLPFLSGERTPHMDPGLRGGWVGLGLDHDPASLMRAAFEGVAFAIRDGIDALEAAGHAVPALRLVGGGTADPRWRRLLADVLDRPLLPVDVPAASARGAALLAGEGVGAPAPPLADRAGQAAIEPGPDASAYEEPLARFRAAVAGAVAPS